MGERPHQAQVADHLLQVVARLAQLDAAALDLADPEAPADERVQPHAARRELPARLAGRERDPVLGREPLELLALDERQLALGLGARLEVPVAAQAGARDRLDAVDGVDRAGRDLGEVDGDDRRRARTWAEATGRKYR